MNRSLGSRIEAANAALIANGKVDAIGEFFTLDYVGHGTDQVMEGHGAIRRLLGMLQRAFPDLQVEVEILVEAKDRVAWPRWSLQNRPMVVTAKAANGDGPGQCCFTPLNRYRASPFWYASSGDRT